MRTIQIPSGAKPGNTTKRNSEGVLTTLTAVLAVGLASLATVAPAVAQEKKPNILFISLVRTAHVSSLDNPERLLNLPRRNECAPNSGLRAILFYRDRRVSAFLCVGQSIHCALENSHCVASLLWGHCLHINIELQPRALFVDEVTTFGEIVVKINYLICRHGVGNALYIDFPARLGADLVLHVSISLVGDQDLARRSHLFEVCARDLHHSR